jgi:hypothetical protein
VNLEDVPRDNDGHQRSTAPWAMIQGTSRKTAGVESLLAVRLVGPVGSASMAWMGSPQRSPCDTGLPMRSLVVEDWIGKRRARADGTGAPGTRWVGGRRSAWLWWAAFG